MVVAQVIILLSITIQKSGIPLRPIEEISANWKPSTALPASDKCVIIKTPIIVGLGTDGDARSVKVEAGGKLTIQNGGSLKIQNDLNNAASATDVVIESDGKLI